MKVDPYYQRQKYIGIWAMILVSGRIRCMQIVAGFFWAGASNDSGVVNDGNFWRFRWLLLRKLHTRPPILHVYGDMLPFVGR